MRFKCRNCGQRVLVDDALAKAAINCPTCKQLVPAPRPGRLWLEVCGAVIVFLFGLMVGRQYGGQADPPPTARDTALHADKGLPANKPAQPSSLPNWFSSQDGNGG